MPTKTNKKKTTTKASEGAPPAPTPTTTTTKGAQTGAEGVAAPAAPQAAQHPVKSTSAAPPPAHRVLRLPFGAERRRPDPREALVRGIVGALPPRSARNALRGALLYLRALDGLGALVRQLDNAPPSSLGAWDEKAFHSVLNAAGTMAVFSGRRRTARARRTIVTATIGSDPAAATQLATDGGFPTRTRSGIALLERVLADAKAGAP